MTINLNEPLVTALKLRLETSLNAIIDTLNTDNTNPSYPLEYPKFVYDYIPTIADMSGFPVLGISDGDLMFEDDVGLGATGRTELTVVAFLQDYDQRALAWRLRRYGIALARCILAGRSLPPEGWGVILQRVRPGPTLGRDESPRTWMSTTAVTVSIRSEQDT